VLNTADQAYMALCLITVSVEGRAALITTDDGTILFSSPQAVSALGLEHLTPVSLLGQNMSKLITGAATVEHKPCTLSSAHAELSKGLKVVLQTAGPRLLIAEPEQGVLTPNLAACIVRVKRPAVLSSLSAQILEQHHIFNDTPPHHIEWHAKYPSGRPQHQSYKRNLDHQVFFPHSPAESHAHSSFEAPLDGNPRCRRQEPECQQQHKRQKSFSCVSQHERGRFWSSSLGDSSGLGDSDGASSVSSSFGAHDLSGTSNESAGAGCNFYSQTRQPTLSHQNSSSDSLLGMLEGLHVAAPTLQQLQKPRCGDPTSPRSPTSVGAASPFSLARQQCQASTSADNSPICSSPLLPGIGAHFAADKDQDLGMTDGANWGWFAPEEDDYF